MIARLSAHTPDRARARRAPSARSRPAAAIALLGASLALTLVIGGAGLAQAQARLEPSLVVTANSKLRLVLVTLEGVPGARCRLRVSDASWARLGEQTLGASGTRTWRIAAPFGLARAPWTFYASCSLGGERGWRRLVAEMGFPERWGTALAPGVAPGSSPQTSCDEQGLCFAGDPIEPGQCGWYALGRVPELLPLLEHGRKAGEYLAEAAGHVAEGTTPRVGALAIWSVAIDPPDGHVAVVAAVAGSRILIADSNWRPTPTSPGLQIHEHWVPAGQPTGFIYPP